MNEEYACLLESIMKTPTIAYYCRCRLYLLI